MLELGRGLSPLSPHQPRRGSISLGEVNWLSTVKKKEIWIPVLRWESWQKLGEKTIRSLIFRFVSRVEPWKLVQDSMGSMVQYSSLRINWHFGSQLRRAQEFIHRLHSFCNWELKLSWGRQRQKRQKFANLTMKNSSFCMLCTCSFHFRLSSYQRPEITCFAVVWTT